MRNKSNEMILFETEDKSISLPVMVENETVWLSQAQMIELFGRDQSVISRHINNVFKENEVEKKSNMHFLHIANSDRPVAYYSLDVIISVGYRVKSIRGVDFRRWANNVLRQYILQGYAVNTNRIKELGEVIRIMKRSEESLDGKQVLSVIESYNIALELLDSYDHQRMVRPKGNAATYVLTYEECRAGDLRQPGGEGRKSAVFCNEESQLFRWQQEDCGYYVSVFSGQERCAFRGR